MATSVNTIKHTNTGKANGRTRTFSFTAPSALRVQLAGDFTRWQESPLTMRKSADGIWRLSVQLTPGRHQYRFLVDGQWHEDPQSDLSAPNPYGGLDSVCQVE